MKIIRKVRKAIVTVWKNCEEAADESGLTGFIGFFCMMLLGCVGLLAAIIVVATSLTIVSNISGYLVPFAVVGWFVALYLYATKNVRKR